MLRAFVTPTAFAAVTKSFCFSDRNDARTSRATPSHEITAMPRMMGPTPAFKPGIAPAHSI